MYKMKTFTIYCNVQYYDVNFTFKLQLLLITCGNDNIIDAYFLGTNVSTTEPECQ